MEYRFNADPADSEIQFIKDELETFNTAIVGADNHKPLTTGTGWQLCAGILSSIMWQETPSSCPALFPGSLYFAYSTKS